VIAFSIPVFQNTEASGDELTMNSSQRVVKHIDWQAIRSVWAVLLAGLLVAAAFQGCSKKRFDYGKLQGSVYTNEFFNMQLTIPSQWVALDEEGKKRAHAGEPTIKPDDPWTERETKTTGDRALRLLRISKLVWGTTPINSSFMCVAAAISAASGVTRGEQYLALIYATLKSNAFQTSNGVSIRWVQGSHAVVIGGVEFSAMSAAVKVGSMEVPQTYYAYVTQGYALVFITTSFNDQDQVTLEGILRSVKFNKNGL
jgi:hypothetical protein